MRQSRNRAQHPAAMVDRKENYHAIMASPWGMLGIVADSAVRCIDFLNPRVAARTPTTPLARATVRQLAAYLRDATWQFDLPLVLTGTAHQRRVWRVLQTIPAGEVLCYAFTSYSSYHIFILFL